MALGSAREYTMVGFSSELDWRPLRFVHPIPEYRVCKACGLVRKHCAALPCGHVLCESCYHQCADSKTCLCPLDGQRWPEDATQWSTFPSEELLKKTVMCWNRENGCGAVMAARIVSTHFQHDCKHHPTKCPKCSAKVLCRYVCRHLRSSCRPPAALASSGSELSRQQKETDIVTFVRRALREQAEKMTSYLALLVSNSNMQCDRLDELSHGINIFKESVIAQHSQSVDLFREMATEVSRGIDTIKQTMTQYPLHDTSCEEEAVRKQAVDEVVQCRESLQHRLDLTAAVEQLEDLTSRGDVVSDLPNGARGSNAVSMRRSSGVSSMKGGQFSHAAHAVTSASHEAANNSEQFTGINRNVQTTEERPVASCEFIVHGVKSLGNTAVTSGCARCEGEPVYLAGYCITPAVQFIKRDTVAVHAYMRLDKGDMDDVVRWPFQHKIKMVIRHPTNDETKELEVRPYSALPFFQKPDAASNGGYCFPGHSFNLGDLISDGYVQDDQLQVKWELLP